MVVVFIFLLLNLLHSFSFVSANTKEDIRTGEHFLGATITDVQRHGAWSLVNKM